MNLGIRLAVIAVAAGALVGCGGAKIQSKEQAAGVVHGAGQKGDAAKSQGALLGIFKNGVDANGSVSVSCTNGGTAEAAFSAIDITNGSFSATITMTFKDCTEPVYDDPETEQVEREDVTYNGSMTMTFGAETTNNSSNIVLTYKGRIDLSGAISDFVDTDLKQTLVVDVTETSVTAKFVMNGTVKTSSETYTYSNETYVVTAEGKVEQVQS